MSVPLRKGRYFSGADRKGTQCGTRPRRANRARKRVDGGDDVDPVDVHCEAPFRATAEVPREGVGDEGCQRDDEHQAAAGGERPERDETGRDQRQVQGERGRDRGREQFGATTWIMGMVMMR